MGIEIKQIRELRNQTKAGLSDCKKALEEASGDIEKAVKIIRKAGKAVMEKRGSNSATEGCVLAGKTKGKAIIIAISCETDFVAKNIDFIALADKLVQEALKQNISSVEDLKKMKIDSKTAEEIVTEAAGVMNEKLEITEYEEVRGESVSLYIHQGNKLAAIVAFKEPKADYDVMHNVAMQVAAMNPKWISEVDVDAIDKMEMEVDAADKCRKEGVPEGLLDKVIIGKLKKMLKETVLLEQPSIKDAKTSVGQYLEAEKQTITQFKRVEIQN